MTPSRRVANFKDTGNSPDSPRKKNQIHRMKHWLRVAQFLLDPKIAPDASPALFARWAQPLGTVSLGDCKAVGGLSTAPRAASRRLGQHLQSYITEATFESQILLSLSNSANKLVNIPQMINAVQTCTTLVDLERCYRMRFYF